MFQFFADRKKEIIRTLTNLFKEQTIYKTVNREFEQETYKLLYEYTVNGKMIRGGLLAFAYSLFNAEPSPTVIAAAGALELFQSAFLIHDDIMDNDLFRRGRPALHHQYQLLGRAENFSNPNHYGEAMGICVGDIALFSAFNIISSLKIPCSMHRRVMQLFIQEFILVGMAQMRDVYLSKLSREIDEKDVYQVYTFKTGRYTFSLPLMVGAILARQTEETIALFSELGESIGIIFQIKDDEIGLFGTSREIGKPAASDIKEAKKTLYYCKLMKKVTAEEREELSGIFGNPDIRQNEINYVLDLIHRLHVREEVEAIVGKLHAKAIQLLDSLTVLQPRGREMFQQLLNYNLQRTK